MVFIEYQDFTSFYEKSLSYSFILRLNFPEAGVSIVYAEGTAWFDDVKLEEL